MLLALDDREFMRSSLAALRAGEGTNFRGLFSLARIGVLGSLSMVSMALAIKLVIS